jgi:hypothetical protein
MQLGDEELVRRQFGKPYVADYNKRIESMVPEKKKKKKKRTTVKANANAKAKANKVASNKANANAKAKANANKTITQKRKQPKPAPRVKVRSLNLNLNDVNNPKRRNATNNVSQKAKPKRTQPKMTPRGIKVKGSSLNGLVHRLLQGSLMNRKEANKKVKGIPMNSISNLSKLRQKQAKNTKQLTFKERKALSQILENVNLAKTRNELAKMAVSNSPGTKLAKELEKERKKQEKFQKQDEEDEAFDSQMELIHLKQAKSNPNGINLDIATDLQHMSEQAERERAHPPEPDTIPDYRGQLNVRPPRPRPPRPTSTKPKPPGPTPRPRGKAVARGSKKNNA